ncbi:MAG: zinc ABC transporter substrate-binding protein [Pseudoruegeria sp.]
MKPHFVVALMAMAQGASAEPPRVVTDIAPVHSLVSQVMGDLGDPVLLVDGAADPHSFQLRPSQTRVLANSDLLIWIGPEFTPWLERAADGASFAGVSLALTGIEPSAHDTMASHKTEHNEEHANEDHEHHDEHEAEGHDEHEHHDEHESDEHHDEHTDHDEEEHHEEHAADDHESEGHDEDHHHAHGADIHAWLDPVVAQTWLVEIAEHLSEADPENAAVYGSNALSAQLRIDDLTLNVQSQLDKANVGPILVYHDAYAPFADRFEVEVAGALRKEDHSAPSAAHLRELQETIETTGVECVFLEPQQDSDLMDSIIGDQSVGRGVLDPTGATLLPGPHLYDALILGLAVSIATCKDT